MMLDVDWVCGTRPTSIPCKQSEALFSSFAWLLSGYNYVPGVENLKQMLINLQNEWDKLFPPDVNLGDMNIPHFTFQDFSTTF